MAYELNQLLEAYDASAGRLRRAVEGLDEAQMNRRPPTDAEIGVWSVQEVVLHLADAELALTDRMKRIIAEEEPTLLAWDETRFARRLAYDRQSAAEAIDLIDLIHRQVVRILRTLTPADFARVGHHSERGRQTLADVLHGDVEHIEHHLRFIEQKRTWLAE